MSKQKKVIEEATKKMLDALDPEPGREGIEDTPRRVAESFIELTAGYNEDPQALMRSFDAEGYDEMVSVTDIPFYSLCEHHLLPFKGTASIAYIPDERIIGLSKIARLVDIFARRFQVQERMTAQIAEALQEGLRPKGVMVILEAEHLCMAMRGVAKPGTSTVTSSISGSFSLDPAVRAEGLALLGKRSS